MEIRPMPPHNHKYWQTESDYRREQAKRGGIVSDIAVSLGELLRLYLMLLVGMGRFLLRLRSKYQNRQVRR